MRGKRKGLGLCPPASGLIPACAGKTTGVMPKAVASWAHPRVCGENFIQGIEKLLGAGSSPRVRGKLYTFRMSTTNLGLIPACAGKTGFLPRAPGRWPAHPRVCGENVALDQEPALITGSSPRVRGKPLIPFHAASAPGLIPACAGKTFVRVFARGPLGAHPRVCGENCARPVVAETPMGSSPRVRGKLGGSLTLRRLPRLIPACAGKTLGRRRADGRERAHPRVCGENSGSRPSLPWL